MHWSTLGMVSLLWGLLAAQGETFPTAGLLPKKETGVLQLLKSHPDYDGRGIKVAVFDSGVDPGAEGLQVTSHGQAKIVDLVDATGSGDIPMALVDKREEVLLGLTGRELTLPDEVKASEKVLLGMKAAWELFPASLIGRLKAERKEAFLEKHRALEASVRRLEELSNKERKARLQALDEALDAYEDPGPVFDCLVYQHGEQWRAMVDTDEDGDFTDEKSLTNYKEEPAHASFGSQSQLNFTVNIHEAGEVLTIVLPANMHGTHVAGIIGGYYEDAPELNGLAPGVQIVSVKIGDSRLNGMETGSAVIRGLEVARAHGCQLINMSYGEPTRLPNRGRIIRLIEELVYEEGVTFVASAGNAGPALTTVGAPGGATSAVIGVGAYVSPEMAKAGYALRKPLLDLAYTWSSRGPAADGDNGVSIWAPGGALSPVPNYTLRRNRHAHGTSMSSPNACGSLAVLLNALQVEEIAYTPTVLKRVIENTAVPIQGQDRFAQGQGLVRVDRALDAFRKHPVELEPRFEVRLPERDQARGLYLREARDYDRPQSVRVSVRPVFTDDWPNDKKLQLNRRFQLKSTVPWLTCPEHLFITNRPTSFKIDVDPTKMTGGVHAGEIQAFADDLEAAKAGPAFRLPATLIRPEPAQLRWSSFGSLAAGQVKRHFLQVPEGVDWVEVSFTNQASQPHTVRLHLMQTLAQRRHDETGVRLGFSGTPRETSTSKVAVVAGQTLEVALASEWSNQSDAEYELKLAFHGLRSDSATVHLSAGAPMTQVAVTASQDGERLQPKASLTTWQATLKPTQSAIQDVSGVRDHLTTGQQVLEMVVHYAFTLTADTSLTPRFPSLNERLYEADVQSQIYTITDANGRTVASDDGWEPASVRLKKGDYQLAYHWRHESADLLEKLAKLPLILEGKLSRSVNISPYRNRLDAVHGRGFGSQTLHAGQRVLLHLAAPQASTFPKPPLPASVLLGKLQLSSEAPRPSVDLIYTVAHKAESAPAPPKALQEHHLDRLRHLASKEDHEEEFQKGLEEFKERYPDETLEALVVALAHEDTVKQRKADHKVLVERCEAILAEIDQDALAQHRGRRPSKKEGESNKRFDREYEILTDTLYRKCRAIAYHDGEREKAGKPFDPARFEEAFALLQRWVDTKASDYVLTDIRWDRRHARFGQALNTLNKHMKSAPTTRLLHDKRVKILTKLGWDLWADHEEQWNRRRFVPYVKEDERT